MSLYKFIIVLSAALTAAALLGGLATIVSQAVRQKRERRRERYRNEMLRIILEDLELPDWNPDLVELMSNKRALGADLVLEISELIRGEKREHVLALCRDAGIDRWLLRQLRSWSAQGRRAAADALKLFPDQETVGALLAALDDRSEEVRLTAAMSLAALNAMPPLPVLIHTLVGKSEIQSLLLQNLIDSIAVTRPEEVLQTAKGKNGKDFLRPMALSALGRSAHLEMGGEIAAFIGDPDPEVRAAALAAVAAIGYFGAQDRVKQGLSDPVQFVRVRAIAAARSLELRELVPTLNALLSDENWWVRFRAGEALAALGHPAPQSIDRVVDLLPTAGSHRPGHRGAA